MRPVWIMSLKNSNDTIGNRTRSCQILTKLEFSGHIFEKYSNSVFHENPSSGSCSEGQTCIMKLIFAFCNFANASKMNLAKHSV
jgi:hypothetical protein